MQSGQLVYATHSQEAVSIRGLRISVIYQNGIACHNGEPRLIINATAFIPQCLRDYTAWIVLRMVAYSSNGYL